MSEKELEIVTPETEEVVEDVSEEISEEALETADEEIADEVSEENYEEPETAEEIAEIAEDAYETAEEIVGDGEVTEEELEQVVEEIIASKKKSKAPFVVVLVVVILAIIAAVVTNLFGGNKYNKLGYVNPGGRTIADVVEELGISLEEFLEVYSLPADMPEDTEEMAAYYSMPVKVLAQMYGLDFPTFKEAYGIPDETSPAVEDGIAGKIKALFGGDKIVAIDENTPWGIVLDELKLSNYVGEENIVAFKEYYGLGDEVTLETRYKEIRKIVDAKSMELAAEAEKAQQTQQAEEEDVNADETVATDDGVATTDETVQTEPVEE